jgi:hypothetical protein
LLGDLASNRIKEYCKGVIMNCSKIEKDLLNGISNSEITAHLRECEECRIFQDSLEKFLPALPDSSNYTPPEQIDNAVKGEARTFIDKQIDMCNLKVSGYQRLLVKFPSYLAAAACGVLIAWLVVLAIPPQHTVKSSACLKESCVSQAPCGDSVGGSDTISWSNVSMDEDFFTVSADIELNIMSISNSEQDQCNRDIE